MARRRATKARSKPASAGAHAPHAKPVGDEGAARAGHAGLRTRLAALERERDQLRADVERFRARVSELEQAQAQVRDRISWALDSLHSILDGKP